jgi:hypothetical protein
MLILYKTNILLTASILTHVLLFGLGCAGDLPEYNRLESLRILSLKVDQPEVAPSTSVTVTPYISDLNGAGRTLSYTAEGCIDPGLSRGVEPTCDQASDRISLGTGDISLSNSPSFKSPNYSGPVQSISFTVPADIFTGKTAVEQKNGVNYILIYQIRAADGTQVKSLKRITASTRAQKNTNPTLSALQSGGTDLSALPASTAGLTPKFVTGSSETYEVIRATGTIDSVAETMLMTWFISDGTIDYTRTVDSSENAYTPPSTLPQNHNVLIIGVLRDGRGGEDVLKLEF